MLAPTTYALWGGKALASIRVRLFFKLLCSGPPTLKRTPLHLPLISLDYEHVVAWGNLADRPD